MATLNRYTPFGDLLSLRDAMNSLFEDTLATTNGNNQNQPLGIALDIYETTNGFVVEAALPGVKPENVDITIQDNVLTISGEVRPSINQSEKPNYHRVERRYGRFARSISLPTQIQTDGVQANLEHGVLRLELPKAEAVKPRKISIKSSNAATAVDVEQSNERGA